MEILKIPIGADSIVRNKLTNMLDGYKEYYENENCE